MPQGKKIGLGLVGCGKISGSYLRTLKKSSCIDVSACADSEHARAEKTACEFEIPECCSVDELMQSPGIGMILNLTAPSAHAEIAVRALESGKHCYNEKPLAVSREDGARILEAARARGLKAGCAPDTFMGPGLQACRRLIDEGAVGRPVAASAFMLCRGHESWHPSPEFYYQPGGGPLFDMGPYYLTALVSLFGPAARVSGTAKRSFSERVLPSGRRFGVEADTHVAAAVEFGNGAVASLAMSFDVWSHGHPKLEIYGEDGSLAAPDPNTFGGPVKIRKHDDEDWREVPLPPAEGGRGAGVEDMAEALMEGRPHRASAETAFHVLDIMHSIIESSEKGMHIRLRSTCPRPEPLRRPGGRAGPGI